MIKIKDIKKYYKIEKGFFKRETGLIKAVDGVSLDIKKGKTLGLVGESGCGKTTLGKIIVGLIKPDEGSIKISNRDLTLSGKSGNRSVSKIVQFIFQDPYSSLNPRMTLKEIVTEPLLIHEKLTKSDIDNRFLKLLDLVRLPKEGRNKYPHQFSGGERQRIGIARALALTPEFIVCDEPVSSLDVSIQAQILNLLKELQEELNLTYLFISHDLSVVEFISDVVAVMYSGKIVEIADKRELYKNPLHGYTRVLLNSIPVPDPRRTLKVVLTEDFSDQLKIKDLREITQGHFAAI